MGVAVVAPSLSGPVSIRVELDREVQIARKGGRIDLQLRGVVVPAPEAARVAEIALLADGETVSRMFCGNDPGHGEAAAPVGFAFILPRWPSGTAARVALAVEVGLDDGERSREPFVLLHDEAAGTAFVDGAEGAGGLSEAPPDPPIRMYVEDAAADGAGELRLSGWAVCRTGVVAIEVFGLGEEVGLARLGGPRADVGDVHPGYPDAARSGFRFAGRPAPGAAGRFPPERIVVRALGHAGVSQDQLVLLDRRTTAPADPGMHLHCERATLGPTGVLAVEGWAVCADGLDRIDAWLDDVPLGPAELGLPREDVGRRFPELPAAALAGFRLDRAGLGADDPGDGAATVRVVARSAAGRLETASRSVERVAAPLPPPLPPSPAVPAAPAREAAPRLRLEIDTPRVLAGAAPEPVASRLTITGWAVAEGGVAALEVLIDGQRAGAAHHGIPRPDVAAALPDWPEALRSGFMFACPPKLLKAGPRQATLRVVARDGHFFEQSFAFVVRDPEGAQARSALRRRVSRAEFDLGTRLLGRLGWRPAFRLLIPVRRADEVPAVGHTLEALRRQRYPHWEVSLVVADRAAVGAAAALSAATPQTHLLGPDLLDRPFGGDALHALLGPGDLPAADALLEMALASGLEPAEFFTCDEIRPSPVSGEREPFHKPCFSPDLLLHTNYVGRFWCARPSVLARVGATGRGLLERGEFDLVLRCTEAARGVHHVPRLLCQRGTAEEDGAVERAALAEALRRRGIAAEVVAGRVGRSYRHRPAAPVEGLVSVLIPTRAADGRIKTCIETLRAGCAPGQIEIVCIENVEEADAHWREWLRDNVDRLIEADEPFNWSRFNNRCAAEARGEFLLFLNDDTEFTDPGWLSAMLAHFARPGVGIVGPQLRYPDGRVQHAGMFLAGPGLARHAFRFAEPDAGGYFGLALTTRNVIAVTGACMLVRRSVFEAIGGFDEAHGIINNDLDFCLRAHAEGHAVVYTPDASLIHHEMASRGGLPERFDAERFDARWRGLFQGGDPFFSPALAAGTDDLVPEEEPAELVCAAHPLFAEAEIARILAVKLDHIGDFLTAVPALRRLRQLFPHARITVLASAGVRDLALGGGTADAFIAWEFFHARSGLGQKELNPADFAALADRLAPERFDLAIDLRKHLDTRDVLRHTGARWLAGFDHAGQFGWLDVALEWEGDRSLQAKRSHVSVDLLNLVEAVGAACGRAPAAAPPVVPQPAAPPLATRAARSRFGSDGFLDGIWVCVHPGVGNAMRQWPPDRFAALIDLLAARHGARAVLIGVAEERALADAILAAVADPSGVRSVVGEVALAELPALIGACALFVGNNSGPQHIAASLGVPTVGIHSGVVDAAEWAPLGPLAVAVRRDMGCGPCYLNRPEDCHRGLACLTGLTPAAVLAACARFLPPPRARGAIRG